MKAKWNITMLDVGKFSKKKRFHKEYEKYDKNIAEK